MTEPVLQLRLHTYVKTCHIYFIKKHIMYILYIPYNIYIYMYFKTIYVYILTIQHN